MKELEKIILHIEDETLVKRLRDTVKEMVMEGKRAKEEECNRIYGRLLCREIGEKEEYVKVLVELYNYLEKNKDKENSLYAVMSVLKREVGKVKLDNSKDEEQLKYWKKRLREIL